MLLIILISSKIKLNLIKKINKIYNDSREATNLPITLKHINFDKEVLFEIKDNYKTLQFK